MSRSQGNSIGRAAVVALLVALLSSPFPARAQIELTVGDGKRVRPYELWSGGEVFRDAWSLYTGVAWAPFGDILGNGLRFRMVGGGGGYRYRGWRYDGTINDSRIVSFKGRSVFADILIGYHWRQGPLTLKGFAGLQLMDHTIAPFDEDNTVQGDAYGAIGIAEAWYNIGERFWASADASYSSAHGFYSGRLRLGWKPMPKLHVGLETAAIGHEQADTTRLGAFARYDLSGHELSASAGLSAGGHPFEGSFARSRTEPYVTVHWLTRF